jgi:hypothetical protein
MFFFLKKIKLHDFSLYRRSLEKKKQYRNIQSNLAVKFPQTFRAQDPIGAEDEFDETDILCTVSRLHSFRYRRHIHVFCRPFRIEPLHRPSSCCRRRGALHVGRLVSSFLLDCGLYGKSLSRVLKRQERYEGRRYLYRYANKNFVYCLRRLRFGWWSGK